jgi:hypothetical protein
MSSAVPRKFPPTFFQKSDALAERNAMLASVNENFKNYLLRGEVYQMNFMADLGGVEFAASSYATLGQQSVKETAALKQISAATRKYLESIEEAGKLKAAGAHRGAGEFA